MILTVGNTKGGVGKTALAVQIVIEAGGVQPDIACAQYPDGAVLRGQLQQPKHKWHNIIIDTGGRDSTTLRAALVMTDVLLAPFAPLTYLPTPIRRRKAFSNASGDGLSAVGMPQKDAKVVNKMERLFHIYLILKKH